MNYDVWSIFDAWEPLLKARKAKGLSQWTKLQPIADKLAGKDVKAISFTCCHPSHSNEPVKHLLGSVEGNLHFMLGYGNPRFHLAPYHWMIVDPNTTPEEAQETFARVGNPANPALWSRAGLGDIGDEGDTDEGESHPSAKLAKDKAVKDEAKAAESVKAKSPTGSYTCIPSDGLVYGDHNGHVYRWDLVQDTFFSAFNPEATEAMNASAVKKSQETVTYRSVPPDVVRSFSRFYAKEDFDENVFALVKSRVPKPGTVVCLETVEAESVFGVITSNSIEFFGRDGDPAEVQVFDRVYKSFDLTHDGNVPPASLLGFIVTQFGVSPSLLNEVTQTPTPITKSDNRVDGEPTAGFDDVPSEFVEGLNKSIITENGALRLVVNS